MIIYIARHGQPDYIGSGRYPLTELGRRQADLLGRRLKRMGFDGEIIASPFTRCAETADRVAAILETTFRPEPAISEKVSSWVDTFNGLRSEEISHKYGRCGDPSALDDYPWWSPTQEEMEDVLARVAPFLDRLVADHEGDVLLVGHGASCRAAFALLSGEEIDGHHNCCISAVQVKPSTQVLLRNDSSHLGDGEVTSNKRLIR